MSIRLRAILLMLAVVSPGAPASAAGPALETAQKRQASLSAEHGPAFDITVSVTTQGVVEYRGDALSPTGESLELAARTRDQTLDIGADQPAPWNVVWVLLASSDPVADIQPAVGRVDASVTSIEPLGDSFVYVYGNSPQIALSRELTHIRRVEFQAGEHTWQLRLEGQVGEGGLPAQIHVIRSGQPYANIELAISE